MAQSVERRIGSAEVTGPIPVSSFQKRVETIDFTVVSIFFVKQAADTCRHSDYSAFAIRFSDAIRPRVFINRRGEDNCT